MNTQKSAYDFYISNIYRWGLITLVCASLSASVIYTTMKLCGLFPQVPWTAILLLDLLDFSFLLTNLLIIRQSVQNGVLRKDKLLIGKLFTYLLLVIQWNYILYTIPSKTFWGFGCFFVILTCFLLDIKLVLLTGASLIFSLFLFCRITDQAPFITLPELAMTDNITFLCSILFALLGLVILMFFMTNIQWLYRKKEQQLTLQKKYYHKILKKENGIRQFRHDIRKHMTALAALCEENNFDAVKQYVRELADREIRYSYVHTGNSLADCFVNELIDELQADGALSYQIIGKFPEDLSIHETDFCVLFGNAVENAKEALLRLPPEKERSFYLTIKHYNEHLYLHMENTADSDDRAQRKMPSGKESEEDAHGYGLQNIQMTARKYGGSAAYSLENGKFILDIRI